MFYLAKTPWLLKKLYPECIWEINTPEKNIYLTFDDGPHPMATPFVLDCLKLYNAPATFFCIGKNVTTNPGLYNRILNEGHAVGNHTYDHLNGWKTPDEKYLENILQAKEVIMSHYFRPPYGRITKFQLQQLKGEAFKLLPVMWSVLSGDFDEALNADECFLNVTRAAKKGSIIVFHDSEKAFETLKIALPRVLSWLSGEGYSFKRIEE